MNDIARTIIGVAQKHFGDYKVRGNEIIAEYCPFCNGGDRADRGTFAINMETGLFNCKRGSCNAQGNLSDLFEKIGEFMPENVTLPTKIGKKKKTYVKPDETKIHEPTEDIITYFASRMISEDTVRAFKIGSDEKGNIVFPFYKNRVLTYVKYRKPKKHTKEDGPKEWQDSNTEPILFGMDEVSFNKPLVITEGEIDALSVYEAGYHNVVSVPCGCDNLIWLDTCKDWLEKFSQFILLGDSDEAGLRMIANLTEELGKDRCMVPPEYPDLMLNGKSMNRICKDANEILFSYGPDGLMKVIENCEETPVEGILNLADIPYTDPTTIPRIWTRIPTLDNMIGGFAEGSLTVLSGKRGEGKSTFGTPMLLNAIQQGYNGCLYSGELPGHQVLEWAILQACESKYVGVKTDPKTGKMFPYVSPEIQKRIKDWLSGKFYLYDNKIVTDMSEPDAVLQAFKVCARRYNCKLFVIDNLMSILRSPDEENKAQARFTAAVKAFAMKYRVAVLMVCHPRKTLPGQKFGNDDISGSSAISNLADTVLNIEKPNIRVTKNRDFGDLGVIICDYNPANRRIYESSVGDHTVYSWNHDGLLLPEDPASNYRRFGIQYGNPTDTNYAV